MRQLVRRARDVHAGWVPGGRRCDGRDYGFVPAVVADACSGAEGEIVSAANLNRRTRTVISGHAGAVKRAGSCPRRRSEARRDSGGFCAVSSGADGAGAGEAGKRLEATEFAALRVPL